MKKDTRNECPFCLSVYIDIIGIKYPQDFPCGYNLCHFFGKLCAAENVEMQMVNALTAIIAAIGNDSVSV